MDMQLLRGIEIPYASRIPDGCSRCGASRRPMEGEPDGKEPIIDLGISIDLEGAIYFCHSCYRELEKIVNDAMPDTRIEEMKAARRRDGSIMRSLRDQLSSKDLAAFALHDEINALRAEINALRKR